MLTASPTSVDPMVPQEQQQDLESHSPGAATRIVRPPDHSRQVIASKAGHNIQREEPQLVIDAILEVVRQVRNHH